MRTRITYLIIIHNYEFATITLRRNCDRNIVPLLSMTVDTKVIKNRKNGFAKRSKILVEYQKSYFVELSKQLCRTNC